MDRLFKALFMIEEIDEIKSELKEKLSKANKIILSEQSDVKREELTQYVYSNSGRSDFFDIQLSRKIVDKLNYIANNWNPDKYSNLELKEIQYTEYNKENGGNPSLGIHNDFGDQSDFLIDYQLESNTKWGIGVEEDVWELNDNDSLIINQRSYLHYRPIKNFQDGDFLKMLFFKFAAKGERYDPVYVSEEKRKSIQSIYENYYK